MVRNPGTLLSSAVTIALLVTGGGVPAAGQSGTGAYTAVQRIAPSAQGGQAFELVYTVDVPPDAFWKFKTDFASDALLSNRYIRSHRLISRRNNVYITETRYSHSPERVFRWQTTVYPSARRMNYRLLNPHECGQRFNRGTIQLTLEAGGTRVVHSSYFDFFGAAAWALFPGPGGMEAFLRYTAEWERQTSRDSIGRYLP